MLILWHWKRIRRRIRNGNPGALSEGVGVAESPGEKISRTMTILDEGDRVSQTIISNITKIMQPANPDAPKNNGKWLVFLHKDSLDQRNYSHLEKALQDAGLRKETYELISFGGGDHFIYYKELTNTGLLDQFGRFMHRPCQLEDRPNDPPQFRSVLMNPEMEKRPETPVIRAAFFDQVWKYYSYRYKRNLYEFQEQLLLSFVAEQPREAPSLADYLAENDTRLKERLEEILSWKKTQPARLDQIYNCGAVNINSIYEDLVAYISKEPITIKNFRDYRLQLRDRFCRLLEAMPESIY